MIHRSLAADGHIQNGCQSPPEATSRPAVGSTSSSVSTPPSDGEQGGGYRKHCNDNEYLDHGDCKPEPRPVTTISTWTTENAR